MTDNAPDVVARLREIAQHPRLVPDTATMKELINIADLIETQAHRLVIAAMAVVAGKKAVDEQDARIPELEAELLEQSRIIGKGAERELALQARVAELEAKADRLAGYARHDGLCGIVGGYNECTCGLSQALAAYEAKP